MSPTPLPEYEAVLAEVREVRRAGIVRLRELRLPALAALSAATGAGTPDRPHFPAVERLLRTAVAALDDGTLRQAAEYSLGLARGSRDWPAADRRRRAAQIYGLSIERFRKEPEHMVLGQVAEELVRLASSGPQATLAPATAAPPPAAALGSVPAPAAALTPSHLRLRTTAGRREAGVTVHVHPVDLLRDIDVVVSPTNIYLALPEPWKSSVAASLRRAGASSDPAGRLVEDLVGEELRAWIRRHVPYGPPVAPGTVAATGPGTLAEQGVRRLHHAAVAVPRPGTNDYDVLPADVTRAVTRVFTLLREERAEPPLRSVGLPLLGAGRGGLEAAESFAAIWQAVEAELARGGPWDVHFLVRRPELAHLIGRLLPPPPGTTRHDDPAGGSL
ncbi:hypothetical protein [Streptomyces bambusae]|uniref:Macro domain-containing protein n=1 Tax=Streptomyces bambusae TaxID=1550616 RepID=A0ABS6Z6C3_9ACTN|nr:hypothetical protein [Streptomyces bambusae]MBW5483325.1 hypothetical protein [Streptomyces bambusae]